MKEPELKHLDVEIRKDFLALILAAVQETIGRLGIYEPLQHLTRSFSWECYKTGPIRQTPMMFKDLKLRCTIGRVEIVSEDHPWFKTQQGFDIVEVSLFYEWTYFNNRGSNGNSLGSMYFAIDRDAYKFPEDEAGQKRLAVDIGVFLRKLQGLEI